MVPTGAVAIAATVNKAEGSKPELPAPRGLHNELEDTVRATDRGREPRPRKENERFDEGDEVSVSGGHFFAASKYCKVSPTSERAEGAPFLFI